MLNLRKIQIEGKKSANVPERAQSNSRRDLCVRSIVPQDETKEIHFAGATTFETPPDYYYKSCTMVSPCGKYAIAVPVVPEGKKTVGVLVHVAENLLIEEKFFNKLGEWMYSKISVNRRFKKTAVSGWILVGPAILAVDKLAEFTKCGNHATIATKTRQIEKAAIEKFDEIYV